MTPEQYCEKKAAGSGSNFYYSFRFLPRRQSLALTALYAFCREVDDVVDIGCQIDIARTKLAWWHTELERLYAGCPEHPVTQALAPHIVSYALPKAALADLIGGMAMDLELVRYNTFDDLIIYCDRAAGVVGQLAARIFGFSDKATLDYAHKLGIAFQLTNIVRDVGEDARRGRIYLPMQELQQFDVPAVDILHYRETDAFTRLMCFQIARARQYYDMAWHTLPKVDRASQRAGLVMAAIYRATLDEIALNGPAKVLNQRLSLTPIRKLWLAWKTWTFGYHSIK